MDARVTPWAYCPECGETEVHHEDGNHKQCAKCYQEWFADIDYSEVVRGNLNRLFLAALEPAPDLAELVEAATKAERIIRNGQPDKITDAADMLAATLAKIKEPKT